MTNASFRSETPSITTKHPDGTVTAVAVHPNGEIDRSVSFQADDGATVSIDARGRGHVIEVHKYPDGEFYTELRESDGTITQQFQSRTEPDGSKVTASRWQDGTIDLDRETQDPDGTIRKQHEKTFPDGHTEISTDVQETLPDGTQLHDVRGSDGTRIATWTRTDGGWVERTTLPDGQQKLSVGWNTADGLVRRDEGFDGAVTETQVSVDRATGWETTVTKLPDGRREVEKERTVTQPDGSTVHEHNYPDGMSVTEINRTDGSSDAITVYPDSSTSTRQYVVYPDGRELFETVDSDGSRESKLTVPRPDGTIETTLHDVHGDTIHTALAPDGSVDRRIQKHDGSTEHTIMDPDGYGTTTRTDPDGTTMVLDQYPHPALEVDPTLTPDEVIPAHPIPDQIEPPDEDFTDLGPELEELPLLLDEPSQVDDDGVETASEDDGFGYDGDLETYAAVDESAADAPVDHGFDQAEEPPTYEPMADVFDDPTAEPVSELAVE